MASSSPQAHLENLQDQINTATAQLQSLDEHDENYQVKKMVLKHGLESLGEQYEAAEREGHRSGHRTPDSASVPSTEGHSVDGSVSSRDYGFPRPQKRQRESLGASSNSANHPHKSMRSLPSPTTDVTTPSSMSSFELPEDPDLLALLGGDPAQDLRDMREEQKEQERVLDARRQQELADEEFARQLMDQEDNFTPFRTSSPPGLRTAREDTSQTGLNRPGPYRHPTPYAFSSPLSTKSEDPFSRASFPVEQENSYPSRSAPIGNEGASRWNSDHMPSSDFIDLESDELFNQQLDMLEGVPPSSDLVEIDASTFGGNNQNSQAQPSASGNFNSYDNSASAGPSWSYAGGQLGQSISNAASSLYNGAYNMLDQHIGSFGSVPTGYGGASVYGLNNTGSSADVIDLESYDQHIFSRHGLNAHDPANRDLVASFRDRVDYVANDPTRTSAEIKSLLENIRPDEELPPENREGTPEAMTYALMEHQKLGLAWMKSMEEGSNKGGILADDMGLGKTIQALALMVASKSSDRLCKTTLIVCPVALLKQWDREIKTKLKPGHQLKVYTLHSDRRHVEWATLRTYDVVLTTFGKLPCFASNTAKLNIGRNPRDGNETLGTDCHEQESKSQLETFGQK